MKTTKWAVSELVSFSLENAMNVYFHSDFLWIHSALTSQMHFFFPILVKLTEVLKTK